MFSQIIYTIEKHNITAEILYRDKKGCEKKETFSPIEKTEQETIKISAKITLESMTHLIRPVRSDLS